MENHETIMLQIATLQKGQEKQELINNDIFVKIKDVGDEIRIVDKVKVSFKQFNAILGTLLVIVMAMFSWIAAEMGSTKNYTAAQFDSLKGDVSQVKNQVSYMNGIFESHNIKINP